MRWQPGTWSGSVRLTNNIFAGNSTSSSLGGGIEAYAYDGNVILTNNTISANSVTTGGDGGGLLASIGSDQGHLYLYNNIIWGNLAGAANDDVYINDYLGYGASGALVEVANNYYEFFYSYCVENTPAACSAENVNFLANIDTTTSPSLAGDYHLCFLIYETDDSISS